MPLINLFLTLVVVGVLLWLVNRFIPIEGQIKGILNGVVVIVVVPWLLRVFGLLNYLTDTIPRRTLSGPSTRFCDCWAHQSRMKFKTPWQSTA
jgi:hypothetical protein